MPWLQNLKTTTSRKIKTTSQNYKIFIELEPIFKKIEQCIWKIEIKEKENCEIWNSWRLWRDKTGKINGHQTKSNSRDKEQI